MVERRISEQQPIHGATFNEFTKIQPSQEGNIRRWVVPYSLHYRIRQQAQDFIAVENAEAYRIQITDTEIALLRRHAPNILRALTDSSFNIIDLGCGNGLKAEELIKLLSQNVHIRYFPFDINSDFVQAAAIRVRNLNITDVLQSRLNVSDFKNLSQITPRVRNEEFQNHLLLLLGNTLGNYEENGILPLIRQSMNERDVFVVGNSLHTGDEEELVKAYKTPEVEKLIEGFLHNIGLHSDEVQYDVRFENNRVEMIYILNSDNTVKYRSKSLEFQKRDEILAAISCRYTREELEQLLKRFFGGVKIFTDERQTYALVICSIQ